MKRIQKLKELKSHAWYKRLFAKLKSQELAFLESFVENHSGLSKSEFDKEIKNMVLSTNKPKNWSIIDELLSVANSEE